MFDNIRTNIPTILLVNKLKFKENELRFLFFMLHLVVIIAIYDLLLSSNLSNIFVISDKLYSIK